MRINRYDVAKGHSYFKGLKDYITGKTNRQPEEKIAFTGCLNLVSLETATVEMESLASLNKRCADPVMYCVIIALSDSMSKTKRCCGGWRAVSGKRSF